MPDNDNSPSPEAMAAALSQMPTPRAVAASAAVANPDQAADAYNLGKATGVPAELIEPRLDAFRAQLKQRTAGDLAASNPQLGEFLTQSPTHAKATSDDLGALDSVSQALGPVKQPGIWQRFMDTVHSTITQPLGEIGASAASGYGEANEEFQGEMAKLRDYSQSPAWKYGGYPIAWLAATSLGGITNLTSGGLSGLQTALGQGLTGLGVPGADLAARDLRGMVEYGMMGAHPEFMGGAPKEMQDMAKAAAKAAPYVKAKEPMLVGLDPMIDDVKKEELKTGTDNLKEAFKESLKSATRERTPDLFRDFVAQHVGEDTVGISADTVSALYPKEPEAGDGPLGFLKDLPDQWQTMMLTGADVRVPIADMMTYMDPETFRSIEPGLRPDEHGYTANEVEAEKVQPTQAFDMEYGGTRPEGAEKPPPGEVPLLTEPKAIDMSKRQGQQYARLIADQQQKATDKIVAQAAKAEARRQRPEWKANRQKEVDGIIDEMAEQPKYVADAGIRRGTIPKIDATDLSPEQKELLHRSYYGKDGFSPDIVAQMTGHDSGDQLIADLMDLHGARILEGSRPDEFLKGLINRQADARMEQKYGDFGENVLSAAREQSLSPGNLDLMHAELEYLAAEQGLQMPFTKEGLAATAREKINTTPMGSLSSARFLTAAARAAGRVESALLVGDATKAFQARQEKWANMVFAKEAAAIEKMKAKFDKIVGRYGKMTADSIPATYAKDWVNQIHNLMTAYGLRTSRKVPGILESMGMDGYDNLQSFVNAKTWSPDGFATRDIPMPEWVFASQGPKEVGRMTAEEFREFHGLMSALDTGAREDGKIEFQGAKKDYTEHRDMLIQQLKDRGDVVPDPSPVKHALKTADASLRNLESVFNRFDRQKAGDWYETFTKPFSDAAAYEDNLRREFEGKLQEAIGDVKLDLDKTVAQDFWIDPRTGKPFARFTRENLLGVLGNIGNEGNLNKLAKGYGKTAEEVWNWTMSHVTPEEVQMMSRVGGLFNDLFDRANTMHHQLTGVAVDRVPLMDMVTPHGTVPGWYYPLMADARLKGFRSGAGKEGIYGESPTGFYRATTNQGWSRQRTGAVYPVALDLNAIPIRMKQMIHDIATRPAVIQLSKFFYDDKFRQAIADYQGKEYADELVPFLRDFAGSVNYMSPNARSFGNFMSHLTHNMVSTFIDMNPATVAKHGLTVFFNSMTANERELGYNGKDFAREFANLMSYDEGEGERNWGMSNKFPEIARRMERYQDMARRAGAEFTLAGKGSKLNSMSTYMQWVGHAPIGFGDLISSKATANAAYRNAIARGEPEGSAIALADRAVRMTHGSTVATNKPAVMRSRNPMAKMFSVLYTTFNHIYNRQYDTAADVVDEFKLLGAGQFSAAAARGPQVVGKVISYFVLPALVEEMLSPMANQKHESWGMFAGKFIGTALGTSVVGARDIVWAITHGHMPTVGVAGDIAQDLTQPVVDLMNRKRFTTKWAGNFLKDMTVMSGVGAGIGNATMGNLEKYIWGYFHGLEHPRDPWDWMTGLRYGSNKGHTRSAAQWLKEETGL